MVVVDSDGCFYSEWFFGLRGVFFYSGEWFYFIRSGCLDWGWCFALGLVILTGIGGLYWI